RLRDIGLNLDLKKYIFIVKEVKYLGYIIEAKVYIRLNPKKIKAIYNFLGFANFYYNFILNFFKKVALLIRFTYKNVPFR
ncbi:uncharacterized protein THITE_40208, partial [Thermothielavioides terrestris NRRL 8126]